MMHFNTGGMVGLPGVPSFDPYQSFLKDYGQGSAEWLKRHGDQWIQENSAPVLGAGAGWEAQWAALQHAVRIGAIAPLALISAFRAGAITATGNPSYHGKGRAVDISPHMDAFDWIAKNYAATELIFSPAGARQERHGGPHFYSGITRAMHWDHIHWAMANGGIVNSPVSALLGEAGPEAVMPLDTFGQAVSILNQIGTDLEGMIAQLVDWNGQQEILTQQIADAQAALNTVTAAAASAEGPGGTDVTEAEQADIDAAQKVLDDFTTHLEAVNAAIEGTTDHFNEMQETVQAITGAVDAFRALHNAISDLEEAHKEVARIEGEITDTLQARRDLERDIRGQEQEVEHQRRQSLRVTDSEQMDILNARIGARNAVRAANDPSVAIGRERATIEARMRVIEAQRALDEFRARGGVSEEVQQAQADVESAQQSVDEAKAALQTAEAEHSAAMASVTAAQAQLAYANFDIARTREQAALVMPHDEVRGLLLTYQALHQQAEAERALADAETAAAETNQAVVDARGALIDATNALQTAETSLDEARAASLTTLDERRLLELDLAQAMADQNNLANEALNFADEDELRRLESLAAQQALIDAVVASTAMTDDYHEAVDTLNSMQEDHAQLTDDLAGLYDDLASAQSDVMSAELDVISATLGVQDALITLGQAGVEGINFFEELMNMIGGANQELRDLIALVAEAANVEVNVPSPVQAAAAQAISGVTSRPVLNYGPTSRFGNPDRSYGGTTRTITVERGAIQVPVANAAATPRQIEDAMDHALNRLVDRLERN
jgi:hypothetical protein